MSLHYHKPVNKELMYEQEGEGEYYTICRVLRDIYHSTNNRKIKLNCRIATSMAKSMTRRLRKYKDESSWTNKGFWEKL